MMHDRMVNPIIKVYGHHRSGCNYLCALMYRNFYAGYDGIGKQLPRYGRPFVLFGEPVEDDPFFHPYLYLWGGHDPRTVTHNSLYILRKWDDVEASLAKLKHRIPRQWAGDLFTHVNHVYQALTRRPFVVYYEDLKENPAQVLREIQVHFSLNKLYKHYITDIGYCGWTE